MHRHRTPITHSERNSHCKSSVRDRVDKQSWLKKIVKSALSLSLSLSLSLAHANTYREAPIRSNGASSGQHTCASLRCTVGYECHTVPAEFVGRKLWPCGPETTCSSALSSPVLHKLIFLTDKCLGLLLLWNRY